MNDTSNKNNNTAWFTVIGLTKTTSVLSNLLPSSTDAKNTHTPCPWNKQRPFAGKPQRLSSRTADRPKVDYTDNGMPDVVPITRMPRQPRAAKARKLWKEKRVKHVVGGKDSKLAYNSQPAVSADAQDAALLEAQAALNVLRAANTKAVLGIKVC